MRDMSKKEKSIYLPIDPYIYSKHTVVSQILGLDPIQKIIEYALWTGYVENVRPVSVMLVAPIESGKSDLILSFKNNSGTILLSKCTPFGIIRDYFDRLRTGKIKHILIPDLQQSTPAGAIDESIHFFNGLIEEGIVNVSTFYHRGLIIGSDQLPIRCGLITSIPRDAFEDKRTRWHKVGFLSRCVIVTYDYSRDLILHIREYIKNQNHLKPKDIVLNLPETVTNVTIPRKYADEIETFVDDYAKREGSKGLRRQIQYQALTQGIALSKNRAEVSGEDVKELITLLTWCNLEFRPLQLAR